MQARICQCTQLLSALLLSWRVFAARSSPLRRLSGIGAHLSVGVSSRPTQLTQPAASCVGHSGGKYGVYCTAIFVAERGLTESSRSSGVIGVSSELCASGAAARVYPRALAASGRS